MKKILIVLASGIALVYAGCKKSNSGNEQLVIEAEFKNRSNAELLMTFDPAFSSTVKAFTLISTSDTIAGSPDFIYGGQPDGQGFLKNPDGSGYILVTNHEIYQSISRVYLDKKLNPVKGEYLLDTDGGLTRLCSGSLATPEDHGFPKYMFLSTGESGSSSMTHAIDPIAPATKADSTRRKPALGKFSGENSVPLAKDAYPGKTVIIFGEDDKNGQVYLYVSSTLGDLENGKFYALKRTNGDQIEKNITKGNTYDVEFVEVPNAKNISGDEIETLNTSLKSIVFARVEDLDYRKGGGANSREIYFVATGVANVPEKTYRGRVYRLKLAANDPLKNGKLEVVQDGDETEDGLAPGNNIVNPDNLCVTDNYVYIQEDGDSYFPGVNHNSLIWQYNIATGTKKKFIDLRNDDPKIVGSKYNLTSVTSKGAWEWGAMIDISNQIGIPNTFIVNIHSHTWKDDKYKNPSKAVTKILSNNEGGQTVILTGVPR